MTHSSQYVSRDVRRSVTTLRKKNIEKKVRERLIGSRRRDIRWSSEGENLPRSLAVPIQTLLDKTATSLKINALVAHLAHVVWLKTMERRRRYTTDHGHTQLRFLPVEAAELGEDDGEQDPGKSMSMQRFAPSEVVPSENSMAQT